MENDILKSGYRTKALHKESCMLDFGHLTFQFFPGIQLLFEARNAFSVPTPPLVGFVHHPELKYKKVTPHELMGTIHKKIDKFGVCHTVFTLKMQKILSEGKEKCLQSSSLGNSRLRIQQISILTAARSTVFSTYTQRVRGKEQFCLQIWHS